MKYELEEVKTSRQFKKFIEFPYILYKNVHQYTPPLRRDEIESFTKSPSLEYCKVKMWIVLEGKRVVGRIAGILNEKYNDIYFKRAVGFGWIEMENDIEIARMLLGAVEQWALSLEMNQVHGPVGFNTWYRRGMLVDGFENRATANTIWNFDYYPRFLNELGYMKEADWIQYILPANQKLPEKICHVSDVLRKRYGLSFKNVRDVIREKSVVESFFYNYNLAFKRVLNFTPLSDAEIEYFAKKIVPLLRPELTCCVMDDKNRIAAYAFCMPSVEDVLRKSNGRLFPLGYLRLRRAMNNYDSVNLVMVGADEHWQQKGISALIHTTLAENFRKYGIKYAVTGPIYEKNPALKIWDEYEDKMPFMRRRLFTKML